MTKKHTNIKSKFTDLTTSTKPKKKATYNSDKNNLKQVGINDVYKNKGKKKKGKKLTRLVRNNAKRSQ